MTIGLDGPALLDGAFGAIGLDFSQWSETKGLTTNSGAVFTSDPKAGATTLPCPVALLTVPEGSSFSGRINARGMTQAGGEWEARDLEFSESGGVTAKGVKDPKASKPSGPGH